MVVMQGPVPSTPMDVSTSFYGCTFQVRWCHANHQASLFHFTSVYWCSLLWPRVMSKFQADLIGQNHFISELTSKVLLKWYWSWQQLGVLPRLAMVVVTLVMAAIISGTSHSLQAHTICPLLKCSLFVNNEIKASSSLWPGPPSLGCKKPESRRKRESGSSLSPTVLSTPFPMC